MAARLRKRLLKICFGAALKFIRFFHLVHFVKCWRIFLELNSKGLYHSSGKEKERGCLVFTKREVRQFHVLALVQRR